MAISLSTYPAFVATLRAAQRIDLGAYTLADGPVRAALVAAAQAGASVRVRLAADPLDDAAGGVRRQNAAAVAALATAGADAALTAPDETPLHCKAASVDGVVWLDDRNFARDGTAVLVRDDDPADVRAVDIVLHGGTAATATLALAKADALSRECAAIAGAGSLALVVETESFGAGPVAAALLARAATGAPTRLLVARREAVALTLAGERERVLLARLATAGVAVRVGGSADCAGKLAVAGDTGWIGSANATYAAGDAGAQRDWGLVTHDPAVAAGLRAAFAADWRAGHAYRPPAATG